MAHMAKGRNSKGVNIPGNNPPLLLVNQYPSSLPAQVCILHTFSEVPRGTELQVPSAEMCSFKLSVFAAYTSSSFPFFSAHAF